MKEILFFKFNNFEFLAALPNSDSFFNKPGESLTSVSVLTKILPLAPLTDDLAWEKKKKKKLKMAATAVLPKLVQMGGEKESRHVKYYS